jgi:hypothetical protein
MDIHVKNIWFKPICMIPRRSSNGTAMEQQSIRVERVVARRVGGGSTDDVGGQQYGLCADGHADERGIQLRRRRGARDVDRAERGGRVGKRRVGRFG